MNLDGLTLYVSSTADTGVVSSDTRLRFCQKDQKILGRYAGGSVKRGLLVGEMEGAELRFRYTQVETSGEIHGGRSRCELQRLPDGHIRILEHFTWRTRDGSGTNIFDEVI